MALRSGAPPPSLDEVAGSNDIHDPFRFQYYCINLAMHSAARWRSPVRTTARREIVHGAVGTRATGRTLPESPTDIEVALPANRHPFKNGGLPACTSLSPHFWCVRSVLACDRLISFGPDGTSVLIA
jgi:hypothetical protein